MNKGLKLLAALVIGLSLFGVIMKVVGWSSIQDALVLFLSFKGLIIIGLSFLGVLVSVFKWRFILKTITDKLEFRHLGELWLAGFTLTYLLTPTAVLGGESLRIYFTKKIYDLDWKKSTASVIIERIFDWTLFLFFTIIGILIFLFYTHFFSKKMIFFAVLIVGSLFSLLLLFYLKTLKKESTLEWFLKIFGIKKEKFESFLNSKIIFETEKELINFLSLKKKIFWKGFGLTFLKYSLSFLRVALLIFFLGGGKNIIQSLAVYGVTNLALLFPVPATLGSLEATGILSFGILGLGVASGTTFAMVLRGADLVLSLLGAIFLIKFGLKLAGAKISELGEKISK